MASLDSLVLQEQEFLKNMVGRIDAIKPNLVLVEKTVSRLAQDMLLARGISVILNLKPVSFIHPLVGHEFRAKRGLTFHAIT